MWTEAGPERGGGAGISAPGPGLIRGPAARAELALGSHVDTYGPGITCSTRAQW